LPKRQLLFFLNNVPNPSCVFSLVGNVDALKGFG